jgi:hypothetical protein
MNKHNQLDIISDLADELVKLIRNNAGDNWRQLIVDKTAQIKNWHIEKSYLLLDPSAPKQGDWIVVIDDSFCTMKLGIGRFYKIKGQSRNYSDCWELQGVVSPYSKNIFRLATEEEIINNKLI